MRLVLATFAVLLLSPGWAAAAAGDPTPTISGGPAEGSYTATEFPQFQLSAGPGATITGCTLNGRAQTCQEGTNEFSSPSGRNVLTLTAQDPDGRSTTVSRSYVVDDTSPVVTLDGTPAAGTSVQSRSGALTPSVTDDSPVTLTCTLNDAPVGCSAGNAIVLSSLPDGGYDLRVTARDAAGNVRSAEQFWTVDTVGPQIVDVTGPAEGGTAPSLAVFGFALDSDGTPSCSLDGAPFGPCGTPFRSPPLADGLHRFAIVATDGAGNTGTEFVRNFRVGVPLPSPLQLVTVKDKGHGRVTVSVSLTRGTTATIRLERLVGKRWKFVTAKSFVASVGKTYRVNVPGPRAKRLARGRYHVLVRSPDSAFQLVSAMLIVR